MDMVTLLDRCIALERGAGEIYRTLAMRAAGDAELKRLWSVMAQDEDEHAHKLEAWRTLLRAEPAERRVRADGFEAGVDGVEDLIDRARAAARRARGADDAFAIALRLEASELDAIYTTLLQASPIARFPDAPETYRRETADHHDTLLAAVAARPTTEANALAASLLAAAHRDRD